MSTSPYRVNARPPGGAPEATAPVDGDLGPVLAIVWLASVLRVALEPWDGRGSMTEVTIALMAIVLLPFLAWEWICSLWRR